MLFTNNLMEIIFNRHTLFSSDELIILSGYVGPAPVQRLATLPIQTQVVYGMYPLESISSALHQALRDVHQNNDNVQVLYSRNPVHSKCYIWRNRGTIVHALVGSANFSSNGLLTPYREVLAETTHDSFDSLNDYLIRVINNSIACEEHNLDSITQEPVLSGDECALSLLDRNGEVQNTAGLNWGQNPRNHTTRNDAYIKISTQDIRSYPNLFPPKQFYPTQQIDQGRQHRHNDSIEIIWDDGTTMEGLLEGSQTIEGVVYPKQVTSFPNKHTMGIYFRNRLGVPSEQPIRRHHLDTYGRTTVSVSLLSERVYYFDFSVN